MMLSALLDFEVVICYIAPKAVSKNPRETTVRTYLISTLVSPLEKLLTRTSASGVASISEICFANSGWVPPAISFGMREADDDITP
jgi:hypothetical protein